MAKTRVSPLKTLTLPQLELVAALIGARLTRFIQNTLQKRFHNLSIHLWSDSKIVLHWLSSEKSLPQFVANRVKEIKLLYPASSWHYCPTSDNPADLLTRGITSNQLLSSTIWLHGPPWLTAESQWPSWTPKESTLLSMQTLVTITLPNTDAGRIPPSYQPGLHHIIDVSRETKLSKLIRTHCLYPTVCQHLHQTKSAPIWPPYHPRIARSRMPVDSECTSADHLR